MTCFSALSTPETMSRYDSYLTRMPTMGSVSGVFLMDLHQNPHSHNTCGPIWPSMLTHGLIAVHKSDGTCVGATSMEHIGALGWHVHASVETEDSRSEMSPLFHSLSPAQRKVLAGRGVHLPCLASWMYFCLSNFQPRPPSIIPPANVTCADSDDDDF